MNLATVHQVYMGQTVKHQYHRDGKSITGVVIQIVRGDRNHGWWLVTDNHFSKYIQDCRRERKEIDHEKSVSPLSSPRHKR